LTRRWAAGTLRRAMSKPSRPESGATEPPTPGDGLSFEQALERLEGVVGRLETGELPLEEALAAFEEGVGLSRRCAEQLDAAERKIEILVGEDEGDGPAATRPFDESGGAE